MIFALFRFLIILIEIEYQIKTNKIRFIFTNTFSFSKFNVTIKNEKSLLIKKLNDCIWKK